jgi:hypothetical protein
MSLLAIQVEVNGTPLTVAGASNLYSLIAAVTAAFVRNNAGDRYETPDVSLHVSGFTYPRDARPEDLRWLERYPLKPGDAVTLRIVQVERPSPPVRSVRSLTSTELKAAADREERTKSNPPRRRSTARIRNR